MKKGWIAAALLTVAMVTAALYHSVVGAAKYTSVPRGALVRMDGEWSEVQRGEDGGEYMTYTYHISSNYRNELLFVYIQSYWNDFVVRCGGETVFEHSVSMKDGYSHLVSLGKAEQKEEVAVTFALNGSSEKSVLRGTILYIGDQNGVYNKILRDNIYAFAYLMLTLLLSFTIAGMTVAIRRTMPASRMYALIALVLFIMTTGVWVLTDSQLLLLVTSHTAAVTLVSFLSFMLMPVFMICFTERMVDVDARVCKWLTRRGLPRYTPSSQMWTRACASG